MREGKKRDASGAEYETSKSKPSVQSLRERSPKAAADRHDPLRGSNTVKRGFPRIGEEIQIYMSGERILVLKYKGADRDRSLRFNWVATVS